MMKALKIFFGILVVIPVFFLNGCQGKNVSRLPFYYEEYSSLINSEKKTHRNLIACNSNSTGCSITDPENSPYLYYRFPEEFIKEVNDSHSPLRSSMIPALELTIRIDEFHPTKNFAIAFLTEKDFTDGKLNRNLEKRSLVSGKITENNTVNDTVTISFQIPESEGISKVAGFAVYSLQKLTVVYARLYPAKLGWSFNLRNPWFGFDTNGGILPSSLSEAQNATWNFECNGVDLSKGNRKIFIEMENLIENTMPDDYSRKVKMKVANTVLIFYPEVQKRTVSLNTCMFTEKIRDVSFVDNSWCVYSLVFDPSKDEGKRPISTDPGLIRAWPKANWQNENYELFSWEEFPSILIFDFADYGVQDRFLKRLAFFVEKKGYVGKLMTNEQIAGLHAYNAHDYKAESLAKFFDTAEKTGFTLNKEELELKEILLENGIIVQDKSGYEGNKGALISFSQESPEYLRSMFLCHEGIHGLFFIDEDFRKFINELYEQTDPDSVEFIKKYFSVTPSLNYDISDDYLLKNEFMGYLFQQPLSTVSYYFSKNLTSKKYINMYAPEAVEKIRNNQGQGFVEAGKKLDQYVYNRWGFNLGRDWKISREEE